MDAFMTGMNGMLAAYAMNLTLAAAAGVFVLLLLARQRSAAATADLPGSSHVASHKRRPRA